MNINEFRDQYPEYADMGDMDLAKKLHHAYYKDMPFDQFAAKFGVTDPAAQAAGQGHGASGQWGRGVSGEWEKPWREVGAESIENIPSSAVEYAKDLASAVVHPVDTVKGLYQLARAHTHYFGAAGGGLGFLSKMAPLSEEEQKTYAAFTHHINNRYGSIENLKATTARDPVGVLSDLSGLFAGVGAVGKGSTIGKVAKTTANITDPLNVARQTAALPMRALGATKLPQRMFESVIKPSKRTYMFNSPEKRAALFETALREKVAPTKAGMQKLQDRLDPLRSKANKIVDGGTAAGDMVNVDDVSERLDPVRARAKNLVNPAEAQASINAIEQGFKEGRPQLTPRQAQEIKSTTGRELHKKYGEMKSVEIEANKAIVRGLKEELEGLYPELKALNAESAELLNLQRAIEDALPRLQNRNLFGLSDWVLGAGAAGTTFSGAVPPTVGVGILGGKLLLSNPRVKSRLAIALARARKMPKLDTPGAGTRAVLIRTNDRGR